jgi:hypothetical protein
VASWPTSFARLRCGDCAFERLVPFSCLGVVTPETVSEEPLEFLDSEAGFSDQASQSSRGQFFVVGDGQTPVRGILMAQDEVATCLAVFAISELGECSCCLSPRDDREACHIAISTVSSPIEGGIGSSCVLRLSR